MKSKVHDQVRPRRIIAPRHEQVLLVQARAQEEIHKFFQAIDSYSARAAREPGVTFHQHLRSIFTSGDGAHRQSAPARRQ